MSGVKLNDSILYLFEVGQSNSYPIDETVGILLAMESYLLSFGIHISLKLSTASERLGEMANIGISKTARIQFVCNVKQRPVNISELLY